MFNYRSVAAKKADFGNEKKIVNFLQDLKNIFFALNDTKLLPFLAWAFYQST